MLLAERLLCDSACSIELSLGVMFCWPSSCTAWRLRLIDVLQPDKMPPRSLTLVSVSGCSLPSIRARGLQRALVKRLGLAIAALGLIELRQIVHACKRIGMLGPKHALRESEGLLGDGGRLLVLALAVELDHLLVEGSSTSAAPCASAPVGAAMASIATMRTFAAKRPSRARTIDPSSNAMYVFRRCARPA